MKFPKWTDLTFDQKLTLAFYAGVFVGVWMGAIVVFLAFKL
jgi:hypothetical protein